MAKRITIAQAEFDSMEDLIEHLHRQNPDIQFDNDGNGINYQMTNDIDMPDGEKLVFFDGFCRKCGEDTTHVFCSLSKQFICTSCKGRIPYYSLANKIGGWLSKPKGSKIKK